MKIERQLPIGIKKHVGGGVKIKVYAGYHREPPRAIHILENGRVMIAIEFDHRKKEKKVHVDFYGSERKSVTLATNSRKDGGVGHVRWHEGKGHRFLKECHCHHKKEEK